MLCLFTTIFDMTELNFLRNNSEDVKLYLFFYLFPQLQTKVETYST